MRRLRYDRGRLGRVERTPSGGVRIPATVTAVGVYVYESEDGTVMREARLPAHVFDAATLRSAENAPVTNDHPSPDNGANGFVTPDNWRELAIGSVRNVRVDGDMVAADVIVLDADAIAAVERGELVECSLGYHCDLDMTPGTFNGERYDAVQKNIRVNHAALGPHGWGRLGSDVALRLDSHDGEVRSMRADADAMMRETMRRNEEHAASFASRFAVRKSDAEEKRGGNANGWRGGNDVSVGRDIVEPHEVSPDPGPESEVPPGADAKRWRTSQAYRLGWLATGRRSTAMPATSWRTEVERRNREYADRAGERFAVRK